MIRGIDVHGGKGAVDWAKVKANGIRFAFVKATEGTGWKDARLSTNVAGARRVGIRVGWYHFNRPDTHPGVAGGQEQARWFLHAAGRPKRGDLFPVLDDETGEPTPCVVVGFARLIHDETGAWPILYASTSWLARLWARATAAERKVLKKMPVWAAAYGPNDGHHHGHDGWPSWCRYVVHQYTSVGKVPGVLGNVDEDELLVPLSKITYGWRHEAKKRVRFVLRGHGHDLRHSLPVEAGGKKEQHRFLRFLETVGGRMLKQLREKNQARIVRRKVKQ